MSLNSDFNPAAYFSALSQEQQRKMVEDVVNKLKDGSLPEEKTNQLVQILYTLAHSKDYHVRRAVAGNTSTPPETLKELAEDEDEDDLIRRAVAGNTSTPPETLKELAEDEDDLIRQAVAGNKNTPSDVLIVLTNNPTEKVRDSARETLKKTDVHNTNKKVFEELGLVQDQDL